MTQEQAKELKEGKTELEIKLSICKHCEKQALQLMSIQPMKNEKQALNKALEVTTAINDIMSMVDDGLSAIIAIAILTMSERVINICIRQASTVQVKKRLSGKHLLEMSNKLGGQEIQNDFDKIMIQLSDYAKDMNSKINKIELILKLTEFSRCGY